MERTLLIAFLLVGPLPCQSRPPPLPTGFRGTEAACDSDKVVFTAKEYVWETHGRECLAKCSANPACLAFSLTVAEPLYNSDCNGYSAPCLGGKEGKHTKFNRVKQIDFTAIPRGYSWGDTTCDLSLNVTTEVQGADRIDDCTDECNKVSHADCMAVGYLEGDRRCLLYNVLCELSPGENAALRAVFVNRMFDMGPPPMGYEMVREACWKQTSWRGLTIGKSVESVENSKCTNLDTCASVCDKLKDGCTGFFIGRSPGQLIRKSCEDSESSSHPLGFRFYNKLPQPTLPPRPKRNSGRPYPKVPWAPPTTATEEEEITTKATRRTTTTSHASVLDGWSTVLHVLLTAMALVHWNP